MVDEFNLPRDDEHAVVVGRNGTGKSQFGAWLLSKRNLRHRPNVIVDYKGEELFNSLQRARHIDHREIPKKPGLYVLHSYPHMQEETENWLWNVWKKGNTGLFIDEGYMLPQSARFNAFEAILTQGRSKRIPVITLSQRPVRVSRFAFSEASYLAAFNLSDRRDMQTLGEIVPDEFFEWVPPEYSETGIPPYHARWYSVKANGGRGAYFVVKPVPKADEIRDAIDSQLDEKRRWF